MPSLPLKRFSLYRWENRRDVIAYMLLCENGNGFHLFKEPEPAEDEKLRWVEKYELAFKEEMNQAQQRLRDKNERAAKRKEAAQAKKKAAATAQGVATGPTASSSMAGMPPPAGSPKKRRQAKPKHKCPLPPGGTPPAQQSLP